MTIKDSFETEGLVTTSGAPELAGHVPETDADAVALLKAAGAIVFAKTNLPIYAGDIQTFNDLHGLTRNPWDPERTVGGSSGGAAAALAAGYTLLELGSDIGGSIRCPAHYCGVAGLKPTWWVVSSRGHIPGPPGERRVNDLSVAGPMARTVRDLQLAMDVLTDAGVHGIPGTRLPSASPAVEQLQGCRVGVWADDPTAPLGHQTAAALHDLATTLAEAGAHVDLDVRPRMSTAEWFALYYELLVSVMAQRMDADTRALLAAVANQADPGSTDPAEAAARGATLSHQGWMEADERRHRLIAEWDEVFAVVDVMLAPVAPTAAFPHDETPITHRTLEVDGVAVPAISHLAWAGLASLPYLPSASVPIGRDAAGLPIGVQVIAPRWADMTALAFAQQLETITGGFRPPPLTAPTHPQQEHR